jgi:hypothetical protein
MSQKGAVHFLVPVIVVVVISLIGLSKAQTTTKFPDSSVQGVIARNDNNKAVVFSDKVSPSVEKSKKTDAEENNPKIEVSRADTKNKIQEQEDIEEDESTESAEQDDEEEIQEPRVVSKFPLRIDVSTNQLIMTKNGVERVLTTLPEKAVQNMLRAHLKKGLGPKFFQATSSATLSAAPEEEPIASGSADISVLENQVSLEEENGQMVYRIPSKKKLKLLGIIPITTDLTGIVSAQTGVLIEERQSFLSRILDLLSS